MWMTAQWAHSCWPSRHQLCYVQVRSLCDMVFTLHIRQRCAVACRTNSTQEQGYLLGVEFSIPKWWWGRQGVNIIWHLQNITYKWRVIWNIFKTCTSFNRSLAFSLTKLVGFFFVLDFVEPGNLILLRNAENVHSEGDKKHIPRIISIRSNLYGFLRETSAAEVISSQGSTQEWIACAALCYMAPSGRGKWIPRNLLKTTEEPLVNL